MTKKVQAQAKASSGTMQVIELADTALDAAVGAGEETVILQYGSIGLQYLTRKGGDPDQPIITGRIY